MNGVFLSQHFSISQFSVDPLGLLSESLPRPALCQGKKFFFFLKPSQEVGEATGPQEKDKGTR
jgi:hypothetical protein